MDKRYFEFQGADATRGTASSSKFWEVWIEGATLYTRFGKIGANGQTTVKEFPNVDAAKAGRDKSISEKLKKGYLEASSVESIDDAETPLLKKEAPKVDERWNLEGLFEIARLVDFGLELYAKHSSSPRILNSLMSQWRDRSEEEDSTILSYLIENPNLPQDLLIEAYIALADGSDYDRDSAISHWNPSTPLEVFNALADFDEYIVAELAACEHVPPQLLAQLAAHEDRSVREAIAGNPRTPGKALEGLCTEEDFQILVASNPNTPEKTLTRLATLEEFRYAVADNPSTPSATLMKLAEDDDEEISRALARNPSTPSSVLVRLAGEQIGFVRQWVAGNPFTPEPTLLELANDSDEDVRQAVGQNPNTPSPTLAQLSADKVRLVRWGVAGNPKTPPTILAQLATDKDEDVRQAVAANPNTPSTALTQLANDKKKPVRSEVAENPNTPSSTLTQLADDQEQWVRYGVSLNPNASATALIHLANDGFVRSNVAEHPNTPVDLLADLSRDVSDLVQAAVANNPKTPIVVFEAMFRHSAESSSKGESFDANQNLGESEGSKPAAPRCLTCGANLSSSAKFCSSCGGEVSSGGAFCSQCGASRVDGARFCGECGNKF